MTGVQVSKLGCSKPFDGPCDVSDERWCPNVQVGIAECLTGVLLLVGFLRVRSTIVGAVEGKA